MIDTKGMSTLRKETKFRLHVHNQMKFGKLKTVKGFQVDMTIISRHKFGNKISFLPTNKLSTPTTEINNLEEFKSHANPFLNEKSWTKQKRILGVQYFNYLHSFNPIYISKQKRGKYDIQLKSKFGSGLGCYFIEQVNEKNGILSFFNGNKCLFVNSYNSGYVNGFIVIPIKN